MQFKDVPDAVRRRMSKIRKTNTKPELVVRRLVRKLGYGYRLHRKDLPGTPDLVFSGRRKIIFVHGCFWHQHDCHLGSKQPRSRISYWGPKLTRNVARDASSKAALEAHGWTVMVVWECETRDEVNLLNKLDAFLTERPHKGERSLDAQMEEMSTITKSKLLLTKDNFCWD